MLNVAHRRFGFQLISSPRAQRDGQGIRRGENAQRLWLRPRLHGTENARLALQLSVQKTTDIPIDRIPHTEEVVIGLWDVGQTDPVLVLNEPVLRNTLSMLQTNLHRRTRCLPDVQEMSDLVFGPVRVERWSQPS